MVDIDYYLAAPDPSKASIALSEVLPFYDAGARKLDAIAAALVSYTLSE